METKFKTYQTEIKQLEGEHRSMSFLISTDAVDRDNDILDPKGWQLDTYRTNPIVAFAHDYKSLPVAKCTAIRQTAKGLEATAEFPAKGIHPFADTVYDMLKGGFLNATSVGFRPIDYEQASDRKGYNFKTQELTEFSIVPIPSNPEALVTQRSASSEQVGQWCKAITEWASRREKPAAVALKAWIKKSGKDLPYDAATFDEFEKDYLVETDDGTKAITDDRLEKLLKMNGLLAKATDNLAKAHVAAMNAYANAHHAESVLGELCQAQGKALSGNHLNKAKEAMGAVARAKGHAMDAAQQLASEPDADDKALKAAEAEAMKLAAADRAALDKAQDQEVVLTLIDNPNSMEIKDDMLRDVLGSLGPELAELISGQTRAALNHVLGRID